mgnify:CR=1 FL=1|jgi:hypothetical protein
MIKKYVVFLSPGTFVAEKTTLEVKSWNIEEAKEKAKTIKERYNATPYGFYFINKKQDKPFGKIKVIKQSNMYYLGGIIKTLEEIKKENNPKNNILISNMENNKFDRIIINNNSWEWTQPFNEGDIVL